MRKYQLLLFFIFILIFIPFKTFGINQNFLIENFEEYNNEDLLKGIGDWKDLGGIPTYGQVSTVESYFAMGTKSGNFNHSVGVLSISTSTENINFKIYIEEYATSTGSFSTTIKNNADALFSLSFKESETTYLYYDSVGNPLNATTTAIPLGTWIEINMEVWYSPTVLIEYTINNFKTGWLQGRSDYDYQFEELEFTSSQFGGSVYIDEIYSDNPYTTSELLSHDITDFSFNWADYNSTTEEVDIRMMVHGYNLDKEFNSLLFFLMNSTGTIIVADELLYMMDRNGQPTIDGKPIFFSATTPRYDLPVDIYDVLFIFNNTQNGNTGRWKTYKINVNEDMDYTKTEWSELQKKIKETNELIRQSIQDEEEWHWLKSPILEIYNSFTDLFPISWIKEIFDTWKTEKDNFSGSTGTSTAFVLTFDMGTSTASGFLTGKSLKIVDFTEAQNTYGEYFLLFRNILSYFLWISLMMVLFNRIKKFFNTTS